MFDEMFRSEIVEALNELAGDYGTRAEVDLVSVNYEYQHGRTNPDFRPNAVEIPHTNTGYGSGVLELSNKRRILADFPYLMTERGQSLWFVLDDDMTTTSDDEELEDVLRTVSELIRGLESYPAYDDGDYSNLETEMIEEQWENWGWPGETPEIPWDEQGLGFYLEEGGLWITKELEARLNGEPESAAA